MRLRILNPYGKFLYVLVGWIAVLLINLLVVALVGPVVGPVLYVVVLFGWILVGARIFRVPEEPIEPPRPWWRLTGRPTAGFVLAALFALQAITNQLTLVLSDRGRAGAGAGDDGGVASITVVTVACAIAAVAYLSSSLRLSARKAE
ncbi:hypothetical protein ITJ64_03420 [Herbiconiux sp. VKM Ac-1786]|uniref:hypothetical protein n=1 Tax=Herbiconiux sp. VKM Ac-1786 TaxID=2783824 RepID=UPI00188B6783|nr:hypothetical protein [Herbiconiux sp. VKM Ac-1786]MBF4571557.1 hypothetical protein [Herbiconiux sp. VKM Ac-1786]